MPNRCFTSRQVTAITGLTARQLSYWRKTGLIAPSHYTPGGHARYSFSDLIALKTARRLLDTHVSVQRIRNCVTSLTRFLPTTNRPLGELALVVTGDVVLVLHGRNAFDALTGQEWVLPVGDLLREINDLHGNKGNTPKQGELFPGFIENQEEHVTA